ncbi:MAG: c-type cytochrome [Blastocatellia bacterium]
MNERTLRPSTRARVFVLAFAATFTILIIKPGGGSAHIPITTKIMFDREVVRILQRNCVSCHHPGGIAFSLQTYDDARPWAKDLEYEVLRKQMPVWRVMKGYGDFSNAPQMTI